MIKYIGSKRKLLPNILQVIQSLPDVRTVLDLFSGTSRVAHALKQVGYQVTANDHNAYAHKLAQCYVQADGARWTPEARTLIAELNRVPGRPGYFTRTLCEEARYFQPHNGERIDAIRDAIAGMALPEELEAIMLVSLMEAADRVDSTVGLQMAYLKQWAPRSFNRLEMRLPELVPGHGMALQMDALDAAGSATYDLVYLDPPYNQHKYRNNYHVWETLVRWDAPKAYGVARKRVDCREYKSAFNSKGGIRGAIRDVVARIDARYLVVSFSDEGYLGVEEMVEVLSDGAEVRVLGFDNKRYVGAQIGISNPRGVKVGSVSHLRNREMLFIVDRERRGALSMFEQGEFNAA